MYRSDENGFIEALLELIDIIDNEVNEEEQEYQVIRCDLVEQEINQQLEVD